MDYLRILVIFCVTIVRGRTALNQNIIDIEAIQGENAVFKVPHSSYCHGYTLYDPNNTAIFHVNRYGSNLQNWASDRAEFTHSGDSFILTIKFTRMDDGGDYNFSSGSNKTDSECIKTFRLKVKRRVDGGWTIWSTFGPCSKTCGRGVEIRHRYCTDPEPMNGGDNCSGNAEDRRFCDHGPCPVDGGWTTWSTFGPCSKTCSRGVEIRHRQCTNPEPMNGGENCSGNAEDRQFCDHGPCSVDGGWSEWSEYGSCSVSCGEGTMIRFRQCSSPQPTFGGSNCSGPANDTTPCYKPLCPVDGGWSAWSAHGPCSVSCGEGQNFRYRHCSNPTPSHGGRTCLGASSELKPCETRPCPVDGGWSQWSEYGSCSAICGREGTKVRFRQCSSPRPRFGGRDCSGPSNEITSCYTLLCPVDGGWAEWSEYGSCSVSCGEGSKVRIRQCSSPRPKNGGSDCLGPANDTAPCYNPQCPVNGGWSKWSEYGNCSVSCGEGTMVRFRQCSSPRPRFGGSDCSGPANDTTPCYKPLCPAATFSKLLMIAGIAVGAIVLIVAVICVTVFIMSRNRRKTRRKSQDRIHADGTEMQNINSQTVSAENHTCFEPDSDDPIYNEIPSEFFDDRQNCRPLYEELQTASRCTDCSYKEDSENNYCKVDLQDQNKERNASKHCSGPVDQIEHSSEKNDTNSYYRDSTSRNAIGMKLENDKADSSFKDSEYLIPTARELNVNHERSLDCSSDCSEEYITPVSPKVTVLPIQG